MRTSFHHQPEAQHPNFPLSVSWQADYPSFGRFCRRSPRDGLRDLRRELNPPTRQGAIGAPISSVALNAAKTDPP
jgi:hypothetical protein